MSEQNVQVTQALGDLVRVPTAPGYSAEPEPVSTHSLGPSGEYPSRVDELDFDDTFDDQCWNCGGEGFVSDCFEEYACMYPEDGCDLCTRRCDVCNPRPSDRDRNPEGGDA